MPSTFFIPSKFSSFHSVKNLNTLWLTGGKWALFCGTLLLTATSCQKEVDSIPSPSAVTGQAVSKLKNEPKPVRNGKYLKFDSRKDFERVLQEISVIPAGMSMDEHLEKWEKNHYFHSLRESKARKAKAAEQKGSAITPSTPPAEATSLAANTSLEEDYIPVFYDPTTDPTTGGDFIQDDYLATILSPDQTVQIGDLIYHLDGDTNHIYYTAIDNGEIYDELISQQPSSPDIYWYPMDQNVFELQDAGVEGTVSTSEFSIGGGSGIGCGSNAPGKKDEGGVQYSRNQRLDYKLVYQSVGIYFSIVAKGESQVKSFGIWWAQTSSLKLVPLPAVRWLPKCQTSWAYDVTTYYNDKQPQANNASRSKVTHRYYESTRGLAKYDCKVQMFDQDGRVAGRALQIQHL